MNTTKTHISRLKIPVFNRFPIRQRLPLFIFILLLLVVLAFGCISYIGVRNTSISARAERITNLADKLTDMFKQSMEHFVVSGKAIADQQSIINYLANRNKTDSIKAIVSFRDKEKKDTSVKLIQLLNKQQEVMLSATSNGIYLRPDLNRLNGIGRNRYASVGKIFTVKDAMYFPVLIPVKSNVATIGYLVIWTMLHATPESIEQLGQLLGSDGKIYFGNDDGKFWTNLLKPVAQPSIDLARLRTLAEYERKDGEQVMGAMRPIPSSKWLLWVELSSTTLYEPINHYLHWMIILGAILVVAGSLGGWIMSRNITIPLKQLKNAAANIAKGDYKLQVESIGKDELAELAASFNIMAMNVRTAQENLERKVLERTQELQNAVEDIKNEKENAKRKDEFISIASHELRTPLTTIKSFFQFTGKELPPESKSMGLINRASRQVKRMENLIDDLLDVSRINTGKMEYRMEVTDFLPLLTDIIDSVQQISPNHRFIIEQSVAVRIKVDHNRIEQAFINLLNNAVKFSPDADRVLIRCELIAGSLFVRIKDFGIGISSQHLDKLFDKFVQTERDHRFQGLGLGLFISSEIIKRHGGQISVISQPGVGSEFTVQLPIEQG